MKQAVETRHGDCVHVISCTTGAGIDAFIEQQATERTRRQLPERDVTRIDNVSFLGNGNFHCFHCRSQGSATTLEALHRLAAASGDTVIQTLLTASIDDPQRQAAQAFMTREFADLRQRVTTPSQTTNKINIVKLDVSTYSGEGVGRLHLNRWFCEIDIAVKARQLSTEPARTRFILSMLTGKAKEWVLGKLVVDASGFPTMQAMKADLRLAFEPSQDERVQRSAFLSLKQ